MSGEESTELQILNEQLTNNGGTTFGRLVASKALPLMITSGFMMNKTASVQSVRKNSRLQRAKENLPALITATTRDKYEAYFAANAIRQSACSMKT
jgi:hypothetical protein